MIVHKYQVTDFYENEEDLGTFDTKEEAEAAVKQREADTDGECDCRINLVEDETDPWDGKMHVAFDYWDLGYLKFVVKQKLDGAEDMAKVPNQMYADEWANEAKRWRRILEALEAAK